MRLFVSVDMPQEMITKVMFIQEALLDTKNAELRLIDPEQLHITLAFLDEVDDKKVPLIQDALRTLVFKPFQFCLGTTVGALPKNDQMRVIKIAIECKELELLVKQVQTILAPFYTPAKRAFLCHLTIARIKKVYDQQGFLDDINQAKVLPMCTQIDSFALKQSIVRDAGSEHSIVEKYAAVSE